MNRSAREVFIVGTAACMPNAPVSNDEMEAVLGMVGGKPSRARRIVLRNNGVRRRFYAIDRRTGLPSHSNAQLAAAAVRALADDEFDLTELRCLASGTSMADQLMPSHAAMVHGELGGQPLEVVSTAGVCLAGIAALKFAYLSVLAGNSDNAVATGSEVASAGLLAQKYAPESAQRLAELEAHPEIAFEKDFLRWMLSDGAGAVLLRHRPRQRGPSLRIDWIELGSQAHAMPACMYAGAVKRADGSLHGWFQQAPEDWLRDSVFAVKQDVRLLNDHIVEQTLAQPLSQLIKRRGLNLDAIDWFLPHMSSEYFRQPISACLHRIGFPIPPERWFTNLAQMGNTGSAAFYVMLDELFRSGRLQPGQRLLCFVPESSRFSYAFLHLTLVANA